MKQFQMYPSALATKEGKRTIKLYNRVSLSFTDPPTHAHTEFSQAFEVQQ